MSQQRPKPPIASLLATLVGVIVIMSLFLTLTLAYPLLHPGIAIAIGLVLGMPFIAWGLHLHPQSIPVDGASRGFWPTRTEARRVLWGVLAVFTLLFCILVPMALLVALGYFLPSGDNWGVVTLRLVFVAFSLLAYNWWFRFASKTMPELFRKRLSDETIDSFMRSEPPEQPANAVAAAKRNWQLPVAALVALSLAFGVIDLNSPWLKIDAGPRRTRGLVLLIQWCRGNPNTTRSSGLIVGTAALAWYVVQIRRASANTDGSRHARDETKP